MIDSSAENNFNDFFNLEPIIDKKFLNNFLMFVQSNKNHKYMRLWPSLLSLTKFEFTEDDTEHYKANFHRDGNEQTIFKELDDKCWNNGKRMVTQGKFWYQDVSFVLCQNVFYVNLSEYRVQ